MKLFFAKVIIFFLLILALDKSIGSVLKNGLDKYDGMDKRYDIVFIGHSHTACGIDQKLVGQSLKMSVAKYARHGADINERILMVKNFLATNEGRMPKVLVYDVDGYMFTPIPQGLNSYMRYYPYVDNKEIEEYLIKSGATPDAIFARKCSQLMRYNDTWVLKLAIRGLLGKTEPPLYGKVDVAEIRQKVRDKKVRAVTVDNGIVCQFEALLDYITKKGVKVVLLYIPTVDLINDANSAEHAGVIRKLEDMSVKNKNITLLNFNKLYGDKYELFNDWDHLNYRGREVISIRVANELREIVSH